MDNSNENKVDFYKGVGTTAARGEFILFNAWLAAATKIRGYLVNHLDRFNSFCVRSSGVILIFLALR
jgi:hypothetical protein